MVDEHGRFGRSRRVPDVVEQEKHSLFQRRRVPSEPEKPVEAEDVSPPSVPDDDLSPSVPDAGYWRSLDSGHMRAWVFGSIGAVAVLIAVGVGVWFLFNAGEREQPADSPGTSAIPSAIPTSTEDASGSAGATGSADSTVAVPTEAPSGRAPFIAYRAGGSVWVSGQYGGSARGVHALASGVFALSPNGLTLAVIDSSKLKLSLVDVVNGKVTEVGPALPLRPAWSSDSALLVFTRSISGDVGEEVCTVGSGGGGLKVAVKGSGGRVLFDDRTVAAVPAFGRQGTKSAAILSTGKDIPAGTTVWPVEIRPAEKGLYFSASTGSAAGSPSLRYVGYNGKGARVIVGRPVSSENVSFSDLMLSPDGSWLAYTEAGDDGYSRLFVYKTSGEAGAPMPLSARLDAYPLNWSADGSELFMVEGNAMQGQPTRVSAVHADGSGHRIVVQGAGL